MIYLKRYFTIWAPRQTGKSTYFRFLAEALQQEGYKVCHVNFEDFKEESKEDFLIGLNDALTDQWGILFEQTTLASVFRQIERLKNEKCVLIIDEVEGINRAFFGSFLHAIRKMYHSRTHHALKSVILVGVSNIFSVFIFFLKILEFTPQSILFVVFNHLFNRSEDHTSELQSL